MVAGPATLGNELTKDAARPRSRAQKGVVIQLLEFLASLKLTVLLFALSIFLVLIGTLAQDKVGIWEAVQKYFRSYVVVVPLNVFLPKAWAPGLWDKVGGAFIFLGGRSLGIALAVNLIAAHMVRWKVRGRGMPTWIGTGIFALGLGLCYLIIQFGSIKGGIQDRVAAPSWLVWHLPLLLTVVGMLFAVYWIRLRLASARAIRNSLIVSATLVAVLALAGLILGQPEGAYLRILWQLEQGTIGGIVLLIGSILLFQRRAGIVVIHLGIGLLMYNELFVSITNNEQEISVIEGEESSVARDIRSVELAIVDRSDPRVDQETLVPQSQLVTGETIVLPELPFDVHIDRFFVNSTWMSLANAERESRAAVPRCTQGLGQRLIAIELAPITGADTGVDQSSVYVSLVSKEGESLATVLLPLSDVFGNSTSSPVHPVDIGGSTYYLELRMPREIKPYSVQLLDVTQETYVGTDISSHYASIFRIRRDEESDVQGAFK
ncbi:MAG: hypothetical protein R3B96_04525 [Pirellulaceae bacterium]